MMKISLFFGAIALLFACSMAYEIEDNVYVLTPDNFDEFISENEYTIVEFYAPWCGHCKKLAPEYSMAAGELENVKLAKVDGSEHQELAQKFEVRGFPTLFWFENGKSFPYQGGRTAPEIVSYVTKMITSELPTLSTKEEITEFLKNKPALIAFNTNEETETELLNIFKSVDQYAVASVSDESIIDDSVNGKVLLSREHGEDITTEFNAETFTAWLEENAFPKVVEFDNFQFQRLMASGKQWLLVGVVDFQDEEAKTDFISLLDTVDADIGLLYGDKAVLQRGVEGAGASGNFYPTIIAVNPSEQKQLVWDENTELNKETLSSWVVALGEGTAQTFKKSEDIPEDNNGPVTVLVHKNFDDIVSGKNVFIKYYAPWCGHCKSLAPIWEELGENFADNDVVIAKIDATANYIEEPVQGFPTLVFYAADGSSTKYEGARTLEDLTQFVNNQLPAASGHIHDEL